MCTDMRAGMNEKVSEEFIIVILLLQFNEIKTG